MTRGCRVEGRYDTRVSKKKQQAKLRGSFAVVHGHNELKIRGRLKPIALVVCGGKNIHSGYGLKYARDQFRAAQLRGDER